MDQKTAFLVAATLTAAAMQSGVVSASSPPDPTLSQGGTRGRNLQTWETFRVFYSAVLGASGDPKDWPLPSVAAATGPPAPVLPITPPA